MYIFINGSILLLENNDNYSNLSEHNFTEHQKEIPNHGSNCHLYNIYNQFENMEKL